jgi:D-3-phosphoglycerate dehydrogenase / 2-oxoglutarate reductase
LPAEQSVERLVVRAGVYPHQVEQTIALEQRLLTSAGYDYVFCPSVETALETAAPKADALILGGVAFGADQVDALDQAKLILSCTVGLDAIDIERARERRIKVCYMPSLCTDEVAEHTWALILAAVRKVPALSARVRAGLWDRTLLEPMPRLSGKTLGLIGFGRIARAVGTRGCAFGMRVLAYDPWLSSGEGIAELVSLQRVYEEADVISCHVPMTADNAGLIDALAFDQMKPTAYFVNTARGGVVDQTALMHALIEGKIAGAAIDVLASEPPVADDPLLSLANVIVTPHAGGFSNEVVAEIPIRAARQVINVLSGGEPEVGTWANPW